LYSELRQVLGDFVALYPQQPIGNTPHDRTIRLEVRRAGRSKFGRPLYRVTADGHEVGGQYPSYGVFPLVEWGINLRIMATRSEFVQLHAASMVFQGNGFIFAGDSGCGKSTLAATLLANGWQYLCDEFALVDAQSLALHPFPKALCIKAGSYPVIRKLGLPFARRRDYVKAFKGRVGYINPRDLGVDRIGQPAPVRFIVFPTFKADTAPSLTPITRADAATELYRCCFNKGALPAAALPTLTSLVKKTECFRLIVGSPSETARLIESLCTVSVRQESQTDRPRIAFQPRPARRIDRVASRREVLKVGVKLAYVAPCVLTLTSQQAFAAASNPSGICSTATQTGGLCETDLDCCSRQCNLGVCQ
jgi:HprK-related kinase A